jgi:hypothetical protein
VLILEDHPLSPESIHRRYVRADLALCLARWVLRSWPWLDPEQPFGGAIADSEVRFVVPLGSLLEALDALRRYPEPDRSPLDSLAESLALRSSLN